MVFSAIEHKYEARIALLLFSNFHTYALPLLRRNRWQLEIAPSALLLFLVLREVAHYLTQVAHSVLGPVGLVMIQPTCDVFHLIGTEVLGQRIRRPTPI